MVDGGPRLLGMSSVVKTVAVWERQCWDRPYSVSLGMIGFRGGHVKPVKSDAGGQSEAVPAREVADTPILGGAGSALGRCARSTVHVTPSEEPGLRH